jgi:hypothetical protein
MVAMTPLTIIFNSLEIEESTRRSFCQQEQSYWIQEHGKDMS